MMVQGPTPQLAAASTNTALRQRSTSPRTSRAKVATEDRPTANAILRVPNPNTVMTAMASSSDGIAMSTSTRRIRIRSAQPPKKPPTTPSTTPTPRAINTARAVDRAAVDIAPQVIRAKPVDSTRTLQRLAGDAQQRVEVAECTGPYRPPQRQQQHCNPKWQQRASTQQQEQLLRTTRRCAGGLVSGLSCQ